MVVEAGSNSRIWQHAVAVDDALLSWVEMTSALVLNRPSAMASNNSKPYQLQQIRQVGFQVPDTLVTTDSDAVYAFWKQHGSVIYKSISSTRSKVSRLSPEHHKRLANVAWCPTQFQQYIPGQDYRVHVVGEAVFACAIASTADDYRYPDDTTDYPQLKNDILPLEIEQRCRQLAATLKLPLAGIDLRQTSDGEWYCFEVNPSPGYTFYQQETHQPISLAIAQLLTQKQPQRFKMATR
jgi:glutathione synthase/RimK-type ligase-like ATP-grasp enzyme